jgi:hypothetical protein
MRHKIVIVVFFAVIADVGWSKFVYVEVLHVDQSFLGVHSSTVGGQHFALSLV